MGSSATDDDCPSDDNKKKDEDKEQGKGKQQSADPVSIALSAIHWVAEIVAGVLR